MSRIDKFLLESEVIDKWGVVGQLIGERYISDHYPIWLIIDCSDWGPKPFKVNDGWFDNKDFLPFVKQEWGKLRVAGRSDFVIKEKLRQLKDSLRRWNYEVFW